MVGVAQDCESAEEVEEKRVQWLLVVPHGGVWRWYRCVFTLAGRDQGGKKLLVGIVWRILINLFLHFLSPPLVTA